MATWNSRGLRGSTLEELINRSNEQYREKGLALIQKVPTPITPVRIAKDTRQITLAYFEQKSTVDYIPLLIVLVTWISIYWLYTQREGALLPAVWVMGGCSIFCFLLMGGLAYLPVRFINFPIRVTERNAAVQYLFAIRLTRVMNIILLLVLLGSVWGLYYAFGKLLLLVSFVLLGVAFIGYYILAFKYK